MEEMYYYWLHNVAGIGRISMEKILRFMTPEELYRCDLQKTSEFLTLKQRENIVQSRKEWDVYKEWEKIKKRNIRLLILGSREYPEKLAGISDPPVILYQKGDIEVFHRPSVAVVGARACSGYGRLAAKELGKELAEVGIVVVSGMARGIDGICQWEALEHNGTAIGVLGSGVEVCYPPENRPLFDRLLRQGALVSENPPFMEPYANLFPLRNRIISALADVVVVVEAREKSGTLITVDMALEQGKEVYVVPGRMTDPVSRGCNRLARQGAGLILSPKEFAQEVCEMLSLKYQDRERKNEKIGNLTPEEKKILEVMDVSPQSIEDIYDKAAERNGEMSLEFIMDTVLELHLKKVIVEENGYYYLR